MYAFTFRYRRLRFMIADFMLGSITLHKDIQTKLLRVELLREHSSLKRGYIKALPTDKQACRRLAGLRRLEFVLTLIRFKLPK